MSDFLDDYAVKGLPPKSDPQSQFESDGMGHYVNQRISERKARVKMKYRGGGCFSGCTKIATPFGNRKIAQMRNSDVVYSINPRNGKVEAQQILSIKVYKNRETWSLLFEDGINVETTSSHSFLVKNNWVKSSHLAPGVVVTFIDELGAIGNKKVLRSRKTNHRSTVYNLIVNKNFNFIANGAIVHSFTYFRALKTNGWKTCENVRAQYTIIEKFLHVHSAQ